MLTPGSEVLRFVVAAHLLFILLLSFRTHRSARAFWPTSIFILTVIGYLLAPILGRSEGHLLLYHPIFLLAAIVPAAFWHLSAVHFDDDYRIGPVTGAVFAGVAAANYLTWFSHPAALPALVPKLLSAAIVAHALARIYIGARADLVESRLRLRYLFLYGSGTYILLVLAGEIWLLFAHAHELLDLLNLVAITALVFGLSLGFVRMDVAFLEGPRTRKAASPTPSDLSGSLHRLLDEERIYRREGLTIRSLARELGEYEHRVRQLINSELGFRNFNAFLHHYRIREAREILDDAAQDGKGIAEIAYALGYQSLGPFNKAFKEITGRTPSEYRKIRSR